MGAGFARVGSGQTAALGPLDRVPSISLNASSDPIPYRQQTRLQALSFKATCTQRPNLC